ncbi:MAG TPA: type II toxin-antitoxin system VapC family toxin [Lacibacter sp.]|nr:type II toxin-antitoxin system VapC family toxin [Lacibacter sp.]HMO89966.1 type II toxin-antitoxin system VapC family toxin [Lacibacter sp.]
MAGQLILADTSVLIDYYRKTNKVNAAWIALIDKGYDFAISAITKYELCSGATQSQMAFWESIFVSIPILSFDESCVDTAVHINAALKKKRKQIDLADLFIAATAMTNHLPVATLNKKHFDRIEGLSLVA